MNIFNFKNKSKNEGFTLVEIIVSLAVFSIVALVAVGALLKIIDANKKAQSLKTAINNANFALESMSRELRVGKNYYCVNGVFNSGGTLSPKTGCAVGESISENWSIAFYSDNVAPAGGNTTCNLIYVYSFSDNTLNKAQQTGCGQSISDNSYFPIVSKDLKFEQAYISVEVGDDRQSYVFLHFKGYVGAKIKNQTYFDVQTSVVQRLSD